MNQNENTVFNHAIGEPMQQQMPNYSQTTQMAQNINTNNVYSQEPVQLTPIINGQQPNVQLEPPKKKNKIKMITIIAISLVVIILVIIFAIKLFGNNEKELAVVNSTFDKKNSYYVLKDENGKVLLENIKNHGGFCNGTTKVENNNGEYGIIDGNGNFIAEYGKYDYINQYSSWGGNYYCFYEVTETKNGYQKSILKYDGSILYSNEKDKTLKNVNISLYNSTTKFVLFETEKNYQFLNFLGESFLTLNKGDSTKEPTILSNKGEAANEKYLSVSYDGKTHIYNLDTFKLAFNVFDGEFWINDRSASSETLSIAGIKINTKETESLIIFGNPNPYDKNRKKTYLVEKGKITFETDKCLNAHFVGINDLNCLIQNGGPYERYDINGNRVDG